MLFPFRHFTFYFSLNHQDSPSPFTTPQLFNLGTILSAMLAVYGVLLLGLTFHLLHILSQRSPSNEVLSLLPLTFSCLWVSVHACTHVYVHTPWCMIRRSVLTFYFGTVSCWFITICTRLPRPTSFLDFLSPSHQGVLGLHLHMTIPGFFTWVLDI